LRDVICPYASNALTSLSSLQSAGPSDEKVDGACRCRQVFNATAG
jgi:hypothetical protein